MSQALVPQHHGNPVLNIEQHADVLTFTIEDGDTKVVVTTPRRDLLNPRGIVEAMTRVLPSLYVRAQVSTSDKDRLLLDLDVYGVAFLTLDHAGHAARVDPNKVVKVNGVLEGADVEVTTKSELLALLA